MHFYEVNLQKTFNFLKSSFFKGDLNVSTVHITIITAGGLTASTERQLGMDCQAV
jgi:hypothetical protein